MTGFILILPLRMWIICVPSLKNIHGNEAESALRDDDKTCSLITKTTPKAKIKIITLEAIYDAGDPMA